MRSTPAERPRKTERLEARLTPEQKDLIRVACDVTGRSVTDFVAGTLVAAAQEAIREHQALRLTVRETEQLAAALAQARRYAQP
jgi:uncharacterized protein (DUF1778 family)